MKLDNDALALTDYDRNFLSELEIEIPEDARWEIDADATEEIDLIHAAADAVETGECLACCGLRSQQRLLAFGADGKLVCQKCGTVFLKDTR